MNDNSILTALLGEVRRRSILQIILEQGGLALALAFGGVILLLLIGTQIMEWYWPLLLLVVAFGVGMWRMRGRVPDSYRVAQRIDSRLGLADAISTAVFFESGTYGYEAPEELIAAQRKVAESAARTADATVAAPLMMPRQGWVCLALVVVSAGLLMARYGFSGSLDLSQPLVRIPFDSFRGAPEVMAKAKSFPKQKQAEGFEGVTTPIDALEERDGERRKAAEEEGFKAQTLEPDQSASKDARAAKDGKQGEEGGKESGEATEKGEGSSAGDDKSQKESGAKGASAQNSKSPSEGKNPNSRQQQGENSSLMDKMRDAMANMMSRMKMNPKSGEMGKQNAASPQGASQSAAAQKQAGQKGAPAPGKPQGEGQAKSDEAGEQQGEGASKNMDAQGKMSDGGGEKQQAQEGKSGAGKQDGEKAIRQAEQAAAMGKISELLGKRAKDLTGEVMVEVSSGRQQLRTQYEQKAAAHGEAGGDISRDEVPAAYHQFVQQYFEEIRKPGAAAGKAKPAAAAKP